MYCPKCGAVIDGQSKFCPFCGIDVTTSGTENGPGTPSNRMPDKSELPRVETSVSKKPKKMKKSTRILAILLIVVLVIAAVPVGALLWYVNSPVYEVKKLCEKRDYEQAAYVYNMDIFGSFPGEFVASYILPESIGEISEDYISERINYTEAYSYLSALSGIYNKELSEMVTEDLEQISSLNEAKTAMDNGDTLSAAGEYVEAIAQYESIEQDSPLYDDAQTVLQDCLKKYKEDVLSRTAAPDSEEEYLRSLDMISIALGTFTDDQELTERMDTLQTNYRALIKENTMTNANEAISTGDYDEAIETLEAALEIVEDDADLTGMLSSTQEAYQTARIQEILDGANTEISKNGEYVKAITALRKGLEDFPQSGEIQSLLQTAEAQYEEKTSQRAAEKASAGEYDSALGILNAAMDFLSDPSGLNSAYSSYSDSYVQQVLAAADSYVADWKMDEAISEVKAGLKVLPDNSALEERLTALDAAKPTPIDMLEPFDSEHWEWNKGEPVDPFGNDYSASCNYSIHDYYGEYSIEYRVYKKYVTLTGVVAPYYNCEDERSAYIQVYADGELVYTSPSVSRRTDALTFTADVSGAEYIKIVSSLVDSYSRLIVSDVQLWP